jgi:hypothetical protein
MKKSKSVAAFLALALLGAFCPPSARAQSVSSPVMVKDVPAKPIWLNAEVVHADAISIVVREVGNELDIRTFTYAPKVQARIQKVLDNGGYQYGDKIRIRYMQGRSVALTIAGKPSKPPRMPRPTSTLR